MYLHSASWSFCWVQGLKMRKQGAASVPFPTVHCQPPEFCMGEQSVSLVAKQRSPSCQSKNRSLEKKEATIMRQRLCMQPVVFISLMAASTMGQPVSPSFQACKCFSLYFHLIGSNFSWKDFPSSTFGKWCVKQVQNSRQWISLMMLFYRPKASTAAWQTYLIETVVKCRQADRRVVGMLGVFLVLLYALNLLMPSSISSALRLPPLTAICGLCSQRSSTLQNEESRCERDSSLTNLKELKGSGLGTEKVFWQKLRKGVQTRQGLSDLGLRVWPSR